jgi:two-component system, NarL family, nitrate/nitrite response regulator NarL
VSVLNDNSRHVVLVSDMPMISDGLAKLIDSFPGFEVKNTFHSLLPAKQFLSKSHVDLVILDVDGEFPETSIPDLIVSDDSKVLVITQQKDLDKFSTYAASGARGVLCKTESSLTLARAMECVSAGELWLDRKTTGKVFQSLSRRKEPAVDEYAERLARVTRKEMLIIKTLAEHPAAPGKQLAGMLNISEHTLRNHLTSIYDKLEVSNRVDLYAFASRLK